MHKSPVHYPQWDVLRHFFYNIEAWSSALKEAHASEVSLLVYPNFSSIGRIVENEDWKKYQTVK